MSFTTTLVGPLTTTFTPPESCATPLLLSDGAEGGDWGQECHTFTFNAGTEFRGTPRAECFPESYSTEYLRGQPVFSPGLVCPQGWYTACSYDRHEGGTPPIRDTRYYDNNFWSMLTEGQTVLGCCPESYTCTSSLAGLCYSQGRAGDVYTVLYPDDNCETGTSTRTVGNDDLAFSANRIVLINNGEVASETGTGDSSSPTSPPGEDEPDDEADDPDPDDTDENPEDPEESPEEDPEEDPDKPEEEPGPDEGSDESPDEGPEEDPDPGDNSDDRTKLIVALAVTIPLVVIIFSLGLFCFFKRRQAKTRLLAATGQTTPDPILKPELEGSHGSRTAPSGLAAEKPELEVTTRAPLPSELRGNGGWASEPWVELSPDGMAAELPVGGHSYQVLSVEVPRDVSAESVRKDVTMSTVSGAEYGPSPNHGRIVRKPVSNGGTTANEVKSAIDEGGRDTEVLGDHISVDGRSKSVSA